MEVKKQNLVIQLFGHFNVIKYITKTEALGKRPKYGNTMPSFNIISGQQFNLEKDDECFPSH